MANNIIYRPVNDGDYNSILNLESKCFKEDAYSRITIKMLIKLCGNSCYAALQNDSIVGFGLSMISQVDLQKAWILDYCVDSNLRGMGIGKNLLNHMTDFLESKGVEKVYATVEPENEPSLRAMERMGFSIATLDANYYGLGHGRYVVTKELNN